MESLLTDYTNLDDVVAPVGGGDVDGRGEGGGRGGVRVRPRPQQHPQEALCIKIMV